MGRDTHLPMNRRHLLAGLAVSGGVASTQASAQPPAGESLYIPKPHLVEDLNFLQRFMDEFAFVDLITAAPEIRVTHIPVFLDRSAGKYGTIYGHISRHNPQTACLDGTHPAVIVFRGPHSYISPLWSGRAEAVPTWDFGVVHASGKLRGIEDKVALHQLLTRLIAKFEEPDKSAYDFGKLPATFTDSLMAGIVGFSMTVEKLEGKFKLGQDLPDAAKAQLISHLRSAPQPRTMSEFTAAFYEWQKQAAR
jgi:transcriptional regulator